MLALRGLNSTSKPQSHFGLSFPLQAHIWQPGTSYAISQSCQNSQFFLCLPHSTMDPTFSSPPSCSARIQDWSPIPLSLYSLHHPLHPCAHIQSLPQISPYSPSPLAPLWPQQLLHLALAPIATCFKSSEALAAFRRYEFLAWSRNTTLPSKDPVCPSTVTSNHCPSSTGSGASSFFLTSRTL